MTKPRPMDEQRKSLIWHEWERGTGDHATTVVVGTESVLSRGKWRTVEVRACPVTYSPYPEQIEGARRAYTDWRTALGWVQDGLASGGMLREVELMTTMPRVKPWNALQTTN